MAHCWAIVKILFATKAGRHRIAEHLAAALAGFALAGIRYSAEPVGAVVVAAGLALADHLEAYHLASASR